MPSAKINTDTLKDLATIWAASPAKVESWVVSTTGSVDKLAGPPTPSDQVGGEKLHINCDHFCRETELGGNWSYLQNTMIASVGGVAFGNPCMAASLLGPPKEKKKVGH